MCNNFHDTVLTSVITRILLSPIWEVTEFHLVGKVEGCAKREDPSSRWGRNGVLTDEISMRDYKVSAVFAEEMAWRSIPLEAKCTCTYIEADTWDLAGCARGFARVSGKRYDSDTRVWILWWASGIEHNQKEQSAFDYSL